jgi:predicted Rossmann-fold nucleotide-binding protein
LLDWLRSVALNHGTINERDLGLISVTDDIDEAVAAIVSARVQRTEETGR